VSILLKGISKSYNGRSVLRNLDLEINQGEFHMLLGPSGGGKTTALSVMAGLVKQDRGSVFIGSRDVSDLPPGKRKIGFVFQDHALFPHLNVFENIAYGLRQRKIKRQEIIRKVDSCLKGLGMAKEKDKFPHQLSGGQKQRVALARALVLEPEALLMDEPMCSLDTMTKEIVRDQLKRIQRKTGVTTVYVTHDQEEAACLGDRVSVLNKGQVDQTDSPFGLFHHPRTRFVARFVGTNNILRVGVSSLKQQEAIVHVRHERIKRVFPIRVRRYPLFDKRKEIDLCIHPGSILLKKKNGVVDDRLNRIEGSITHIRSNLHVVSVNIDAKGLALQATVPRNRFSFHIGEEIWACFAMDAPHPLCGRSCREDEPLRKCGKMPPISVWRDDYEC
jgi:ABC-type Fe3+/spermidine/putrescine transport system ATPase subunit